MTVCACTLTVHQNLWLRAPTLTRDHRFSHRPSEIASRRYIRHSRSCRASTSSGATHLQCRRVARFINDWMGPAFDPFMYVRRASNELYSAGPPCERTCLCVPFRPSRSRVSSVNYTRARASRSSEKYLRRVRAGRVLGHLITVS